MTSEPRPGQHAMFLMPDGHLMDPNDGPENSVTAEDKRVAAILIDHLPEAAVRALPSGYAWASGMARALDAARAQGRAEALDVDTLAQALADMDIWNHVRAGDTTDEIAAALLAAIKENQP